MANYNNTGEYEPIIFGQNKQSDVPQPPHAAEPAPGPTPTPAPGPNQIPVVGSTPIPVVGSAPIPVVGSAPIPVVGQPPQPWVAPVLPSTAYSLARQAVQAHAQLAQAEVENQRLRDQEARRQQREEAYRDLWNRSDGLFTSGKSGQTIQLLNHGIVRALRIVFQPPFEVQTRFYIEFEGCDRPLSLEERDYRTSPTLLHALQELPGLEVTLVGSVKRTADLLRQAFARQMRTMAPPYYGGWLKSHTGQWCYHILPPFSTHFDVQIFWRLIELSPLSPSASVVAVKRLQNLLGAVQEPHIRWFLLTWMSCAALTTPLNEWGLSMPLTLCVFSDSPKWSRFLRSLLSWFSDAPLSLSLPPKTFAREVLRRKDQPLVILDRQHRTPAAASNASFLDEVLASRQIPWKSGKDFASAPLNSCPVVLTPAASSLSFGPASLVLELDDALLALPDEPEEPWPILRAYLQVFIPYCVERQDQLQTVLREQVAQATRDYGDELDEDCALAFGLFQGLTSFLQGLLRLLHVDSDLPEDWSEWLFDLLRRTTEQSLDPGDLAEQFVAVARSLLLNGQLAACPTDYFALPSSPATVFVTETSLYFKRPAFQAVCSRLGQSCPVVLHALSEAGLLLGKPTNATTFQTRFTITNVAGVSRVEKGYCLPRDAFDWLGDPLVFGFEEGVEG